MQRLAVLTRFHVPAGNPACDVPYINCITDEPDPKVNATVSYLLNDLNSMNPLVMSHPIHS